MLTDKIITTVELTDGAWAKVRKAGIGIISEARKAGEDGYMIYVRRCIVEWSFPDPINEETVGNLSDSDALVIVQAVNKPETEEETKNA